MLSSERPRIALVSALARSIQDRPIIDKTLPSCDPTTSRYLRSSKNNEEQPGLKLQALKGPIDVLVIDSIEEPGDLAMLIRPKPPFAEQTFCRSFRTVSCMDNYCRLNHFHQESGLADRPEMYYAH